ncbi:unnamed protein product [Parnassius apollo]|uniref:(apollo) hypothetical protein n=1 Tax=Parnassius apollo TaxID=110799 RepID=A0A8S3WS96_PARAO|nr:unnamed protein product [Parnassius apollo]
MRDMFASLLAAQQQEFNKINKRLKQIQETSTKIETSVEHLHKENAELKKEIENLKQQKKEDTKYISSKIKLRSYKKGLEKQNSRLKMFLK